MNKILALIANTIAAWLDSGYEDIVSQIMPVVRTRRVYHERPTPEWMKYVYWWCRYKWEERTGEDWNG